MIPQEIIDQAKIFATKELEFTDEFTPYNKGMYACYLAGYNAALQTIKEKDAIIDKLETEERVTESQLIIANQEIERLKELIEKLWREEILTGNDHLFDNETKLYWWQQFAKENNL